MRKQHRDFITGFNQAGSKQGMQFDRWLNEYSNGHPVYTYTHRGITYRNHSGVDDGVRDGRQAARKNIRIRGQHGS